MKIFYNILTLLGGLSMFLFGMRQMGDGLKESSSGTLKKAMEKLTNHPIKAFLLGVAVTAIIQSSTATIVITSGLVGAGLISLRQSLGIIIGANVGTTVTGQIIRLLDVDAGETSILNLFKPDSLAPIALIIGIVLIMFIKSKSSDKVGKICIGFGVLFMGLLTMTDSVTDLNSTGFIDNLFSKLGESPVLGYIIGVGVSFMLQSSSATIGILQAFSTSGVLHFNEIYAVLVGIYLGDCVTTAIVCNIGAKPEAKRVGVVNILFNLSETVVILLGVILVHRLGLIDHLWGSRISAGGIANTNTVFNLSCAILLFPLLPVYEKLSCKIIRDSAEQSGVKKRDELLATLNPVFFKTPALAFGRCYEVLLEMCRLAQLNINRAFDVIEKFDAKTVQLIEDTEEDIDIMEDRVSNYLVQLSSNISDPAHMEIMNHYYSVVTEFERLGDHAMNISEVGIALHDRSTSFSEKALGEIRVVRVLLNRILEYSYEAFHKRDIDAARHIEPLEEVVDDMVSVLKDNHLERLREGTCSIFTGTEFLNMLSDVERISDICSNIGVATVARAEPELMHQVHDYVSQLHAGHDETFNMEYQNAHDLYFKLLESAEK